MNTVTLSLEDYNELRVKAEEYDKLKANVKISLNIEELVLSGKRSPLPPKR